MTIRRIYNDIEVLVCGAGCAGLGAAIAAARNGAKTLVVERAGFAGGIITASDMPYFDGIASKQDKRIVVRGIGLEMFVRMGGCAPDATHLSSHNPWISNSERFKLVADQMLMEQRVHLSVLYHSFVCDVVMKGERIAEVLIANKAGLVAVRPKVVVDCTGDGDVAAWAGAPFEVGREIMPMTLHFRVGNVHLPTGVDLNDICRPPIYRAFERGEIPYYYGPHLWFVSAKDEAYIHATRVPGNAIDAEDLTRAEIQGRADAWIMFETWKREVQGFENAYFVSSAPYIGVRETRRIVGQYIITEDDIMTGKTFDDAIATGCWYLDIHPKQATPGVYQNTPVVYPDPYDIPYRTLLPHKVENLLVAGRCHSATQLAASSTRVTVTATALGEAGGTAAAIAVEKKQSLQEIDGKMLRERLAQQGGGSFTT